MLKQVTVNESKDRSLAASVKRIYGEAEPKVLYFLTLGTTLCYNLGR